MVSIKGALKLTSAKDFQIKLCLCLMAFLVGINGEGLEFIPPEQLREHQVSKFEQSGTHLCSNLLGWFSSPTLDSTAFAPTTISTAGRQSIFVSTTHLK